MGKIQNWFRTRKRESEAFILRQRDMWFLANETMKAQLLREGRYDEDPHSIHGHGFKVYSQNEEDGLIENILERIGTDTRTFVEFGVGDGLENNTLYLLMKGWSGLWIEGDPRRVEYATKHFSKLVKSGRLQVVNGMVTPANIESHIANAGIPADLDVLSIDIDGNDYWVWQAIQEYHPRLVVLEYNAGLGPTAEWVMNLDTSHYYNRGRNFGATLKSFELLGMEKGYRLVGCNLTGSNAFFVRSDLLDDQFSEPYTSEHHYQPARYMLRFNSGHPADPREVESFSMSPSASPLEHAMAGGSRR